MSLDFEWQIQNSLKENKIMARNEDKINLKKARLLLVESLDFINQVPNNKYHTRSYGKDSYKLASEISEYLKQVEDGTRE